MPGLLRRSSRNLTGCDEPLKSSQVEEPSIELLAPDSLFPSRVLPPLRFERPTAIRPGTKCMVRRCVGPERSPGQIHPGWTEGVILDHDIVKYMDGAPTDACQVEYMSGNRRAVGQFYPRWGEVWLEDHDEPDYDSEELQRSWQRACEVMVCVLTWVSGVIASNKIGISGVWYRARLLSQSSVAGGSFQYMIEFLQGPYSGMQQGMPHLEPAQPEVIRRLRNEGEIVFDTDTVYEYRRASRSEYLNYLRSFSTRDIDCDMEYSSTHGDK